MSESETASAPHVEAPVADAPELSLGEIIRRASEGETADQITGTADPAPETEGRERDANGRFAAKDAEPGETADDVSTDQPAPTAEEPGTPAITPPQAWSGAEKEVFATLPPAAQEAILRRERDVERSFQERARPLKEYEAIQEVLAPFAANYRVQGYTDVDAVRMWATVASELRRDPVNAIRELAKSHGLTAEQVLGRVADPQYQTQPAPTDVAMQRLERLERQLAEQAQAEQRNQEQAILTRIEKFASDPKNKHFETVRKSMGALMTAEPELSMEDAYERAIYANPTIRAQVLAEQRAADDAKRAAEDKKRAESARRAGASVRGAPPVGAGGSAPGERSLRQEIEAAMAAAR